MQSQSPERELSFERESITLSDIQHVLTTPGAAELHFASFLACVDKFEAAGAALQRALDTNPSLAYRALGLRSLRDLPHAAEMIDCAMAIAALRRRALKGVEA